MEYIWSQMHNLLATSKESEKELLERREYEHHSELMAKSQRNIILEDLENSVLSLERFVSRLKSPHKPSGHDSTPAMMESVDEKQSFLNDNCKLVSALCTNIDRCVSHGLRPIHSKDDPSTVQFFGLLKWTYTRVEALRQRQLAYEMQAASTSMKYKSNASNVCEVVTQSMENKQPRHIRGFFAAIRTASSLSNVQSDEGKTRAFIRQALNMHLLKDCMELVLADNNLDLLESYYTTSALFRQRNEIKMFRSLLSSLEKHFFTFMVDDPRLDLPPDILPFSKPLPRPQSQKIQRKGPALIEPEDMISGNIRLCEEDTVTALLTEKLMSYHELYASFGTQKGGNVLAKVLQNAQQSQKISDASTAVLRFFELGYPEYQVFGTELVDVVCNPFLSSMARFDTSMGIPDVLETCFSYLYEQVDTLGLFQIHLAADHVMELRDTIEEIGAYHNKMIVDVHEATAILYQYLWEIPEALFTEERNENFLACVRTNDPASDPLKYEEQVQLLQVLVNDLPWYVKPLLERLCNLIALALKPQHAQKNGLTPYAVAHAFAPILFRGRQQDSFWEYEDANSRRYAIGHQIPVSVRARLLDLDDLDDHRSIDQIAMQTRMIRQIKQNAEDGATVLRILFQEEASILQEFREELRVKRKLLQKKVSTIERVRFQLEEEIDVGKEEHAKLVRELWERLLRRNGEEEEFHCIETLLASSRWQQSGFHTNNPLGGFRGGGLLGLKCLNYFIETYSDKAREMMERNAAPGGNRYPFPVASINVLRMMMKLLMLDEAPDVCGKLVMHHIDDPNELSRVQIKPSPPIIKLRVAERVSRTPIWRVLDDPNALPKLYSMAFMLLDLQWVSSGATQMGFQPVLDATRRQMGWLLEKGPQSVEEMWTTWIGIRGAQASENTVVNPSNRNGNTGECIV